MTLFQLYLLFAKIGLFTFGGGYAMIPLFQDELVSRHHFISPEDFANMVALAQITPGPVGLNAATYVGYTQMGFGGALVGTLGLMTPSLILVTFAAAFFLYFRDSKPIQRLLSGVRPATIGLIAAAVIFFAESSIFSAPLNTLWRGGAETFSLCWRESLIFLAVLFTQWKWKWNLVGTLLGAGVVSLLLYLI